MITLWGVWSLALNDWVTAATGESEVDARDRAAKWGRGYQARPYGQFVLVQPEVVAAMKAIGGGPVVVMQPHQESVHRILNWIAQAVATQEQMK